MAILGFIFATALITYLWIYLSIFCHEMGHFTFAKLTGMSPYLVKIGTGAAIGKQNFLNAVFEFRLLPLGGMTYASCSSTRDLRAKIIMFILGGPLVNFLFLIFLVNFYKLTENPLVLILCLIELITLWNSLIPREFQVYGATHANDGQRILTAFTKDYSKTFSTIFSAYNKALLRYKDGGTRDRFPQTFLNNDLRLVELLTQAKIQVAHKNFREAVKLFLEILSSNQLSTPERAFILDNLACIAVVEGCKDYLKQADRWSQEAMALAGYSKTLQGTRGAVLIELGKYSEGKELLLPLTEAGNEALDIAISSCYLAKAEHYLGNSTKVRDWLETANKMGGETSLLQRIRYEIGYPAGSWEPG